MTFTATVTPSAATGTVTFFDSGTSIGTGALSGGTATLSISTLLVGPHEIVASYGGDSNYSSSQSSTTTQTVTNPTTLALASSPNPSTYCSSVTFTATVSPSAATGTVTFFNAGTSIGSGTLSGGTATLSISTLLVGPNEIVASYPGNSNYNDSTSSTLTQTVINPTTLTLASSPNYVE